MGLLLARTGRPKLYCSVRCRVAAHRGSKVYPPLLAEPAASTLHDALGVEPASSWPPAPTSTPDTAAGVLERLGLGVCACGHRERTHGYTGTRPCSWVSPVRGRRGSPACSCSSYDPIG